MFGPRVVAALDNLTVLARQFRRQHGRWPGAAELMAIEPSLPVHDPWWHPFRVDVEADDLVIVSAGEDGDFGTADDWQRRAMMPAGDH